MSIDEIETMPAQVQAKLLLFLDRMEIRPVGNTTEIQLDNPIMLIHRQSRFPDGNR